MQVNNEVLINEQGEINRETILHLGRLEQCKDADEIKKEMIKHYQNEMKIREKYTDHKIKIISEMELER